MPIRDDDIAAKIADLDARLREVEALQALTLRILSTTRPLDAVLAQVTELRRHSSTPCIVCSTTSRRG